MLRGLEPASE